MIYTVIYVNLAFFRKVNVLTFFHTVSVLRRSGTCGPCACATTAPPGRNRSRKSRKNAGFRQGYSLNEYPLRPLPTHQQDDSETAAGGLCRPAGNGRRTTETSAWSSSFSVMEMAAMAARPPVSVFVRGVRWYDFRLLRWYNFRLLYTPGPPRATPWWCPARAPCASACAAPAW